MYNFHQIVTAINFLDALLKPETYSQYSGILMYKY